MSQLMNKGTITASPAEAPIKRKRGRPRKDESQTPLRPPVSSIQGEGSGALKPTENTPSKGKESIEDVDDDDDDNNDEMVGQVVTGILEYAFDAGYFLTVNVGDSNIRLRGIVFKEGCVVPVTPENDIAPNAKMYKRKEFPTSPMKLSPQLKLPAPTNAQKEDHNLLRKGQSDEKERQERSSYHKVQQEKLSDDKEQQEKSSDDKKQQEKLSDDKEQQEKLSDGKEQQEQLSDGKEQQEKLSVGDEIEEKEGSAEMESLKDMSEPPMKLQKTDQLTASHSNREKVVQHNAFTAENSKDAVKSVEAANNTVLPKEAMISPPETEFSLKDSSVDVPTIMEQELCRTSGFQISMENPDDEDELSEPPSEASPMATELGEKNDLVK